MNKKLWFKYFLCLMVVLPMYIINMNSIPNAVGNVNTIKQKETKIDKIKTEKITLLANYIYKKNTRVDYISALEYATFIYNNTNNPSLVTGVIINESNFRPRVRSSVGAIGLGQIRPEFWIEELSEHIILIKEPKDLYNWKLNILATDYILTKLLKRYENVNKALKHYVGGNKKEYIKSVKKISNFLKI